MFYLGSTFTDPDSALSRHDALLRTLGVALRTLVAAWVVVIVLRIAGLSPPLWPLPLAALAMAASAWRRMSARIMPDSATLLTGRALVGVSISLGSGLFAAWAAYELLRH